MKQLIDRLEQEQTLPREDWIRLLEDFTPEDTAYLCERARHVRQMHYQNRIFIRGLIEFTNYCKTTASIAESAEATATPTATGYRKRPFWTAAAADMNSASVHLSSKAEKTDILPMPF